MVEPAVDYEKIYSDNIESAIDKAQVRDFDSLSDNEKLALEIHQQKQSQQVPDDQKGLFDFQNGTMKHIREGKNRIIHITDTESSPEGLEEILKRDLSMSLAIDDKGAPRLQENDILVHTGDMLQDFIDFKNFHHGTPGFLTNRIVKEGGLKGDDAKEFSDVYTYLLDKNGVMENQLLGGQLTEQLAKGLQGLYFGQTPSFMSNDETKEYKGNFEKFKKHLKTAIRNDAKKKYLGYKKVFEKYGITPEAMVLIEGNHDVPEVMRDILGDYMPDPGGVIERKGLKFANPLGGSTGAHLGPEFGDTFGYTDMREQLETIKQDTPAFRGLLDKMKGYGIDHVDEKDLSQLIMMSQARASQGIGKGDLAHYFNERIQPQIDLRVEDMRGKILKDVKKDVDFYLFHGQPNHHMHAGLEEAAAFSAIDKIGGNIIHGHQHGRTMHKMGNSLLLNQGDGKGNFGVYHVDKNKKGKMDITDIFSKTYNSSLGSEEFDFTHKDKISIENKAKEYN